MTGEQQNVLTLADRLGVIRVGDREVCPGLHYCPDWDFLPIFNGSPEKTSCTCTILEREAC